MPKLPKEKENTSREISNRLSGLRINEHRKRSIPDPESQPRLEGSPIPIPEQQLVRPVDPLTFKLIKQASLIPIQERIVSTDAASANIYGVFFTNSDRNEFEVTAIQAQWNSAASGTGVIQVEKLSDNESLDSGDQLLETGFDASDTANIAHNGQLTSANIVILNPNDRVALKDIGPLTGLEDLQVTIFLKQL